MISKRRKEKKGGGKKPSYTPIPREEPAEWERRATLIARPDPAKQEAAEAGDRDRRKHQRVRVKLHMLYEDGQKGIKTNVVNISMGGAFLEMPEPPSKGTEIRLTPVFPGKSPDVPAVQFQGRVVRVVEYDLTDMGDKKGVAVEFTNVSPGERQLLADIFRKAIDEMKGETFEKKGEGGHQVDESSKTGEWGLPKENSKKEV